MPPAATRVTVTSLSQCTPVGKALGGKARKQLSILVPDDTLDATWEMLQTCLQVHSHCMPMARDPPAASHVCSAVAVFPHAITPLLSDSHVPCLVCVYAGLAKQMSPLCTLAAAVLAVGCPFAA